MLRTQGPRLEPTQIISYHRLFPPPRIPSLSSNLDCSFPTSFETGAENCRLILWRCHKTGYSGWVCQSASDKKWLHRPPPELQCNYSTPDGAGACGRFSLKSLQVSGGEATVGEASTSGEADVWQRHF